MLCGSVAFSLMGTMAHALASTYDWQVIALVRSSFPLILMIALALGGGTRLVFLRPRSLWMRSIAGSMSMVCTFFALTRLPVSDVFTLTNVFPIWVALLSWPLLKERPSWQVWLAVACGVVGVVLVQQPHLAAGNFAALIALAGSFSTAVAMIGLHRLHDLDTRAIVAHFSGVAFVFCLTAFFLFERKATLSLHLDGGPLLLLLGVGITATVGQLFLTKAFAAGPPAKVSVVGLSQVVFALALDVLLFGHDCNPTTFVGMALVLAPTAWLLASWG
jgi:drug/metabolite transporter (DMT)-like permease